MANKTIDKQNIVEKIRKKAGNEQYNVIIYNDNVTPQEFVVFVLESVFGMSEGDATRIMFTAHCTGQAIVGTYSEREADQKIEQVQQTKKSEMIKALCFGHSCEHFRIEKVKA